MDLTQLADPQTLTNLLRQLLGAKCATWLTAVVLWVGALRLIFKIISPAIQRFADGIRSWLDASGNTDIRRRVDAFEARVWVRFAFWLLDYLTSIKLGTQRKVPPAIPPPQ
jgi:hypothetical protein